MGTLPSRPVVAVDVDGTIGRYHEHFIRFAQEYLGPEVDLEPNWDPEFKGEFNEALGLEKHVYRDIKLAYRQGGQKRSMPLFQYAKEMIDSFREAGAEVWICTTRPWMRLDNIDPDTRHFFDRNLLKFDGLIYGEDKYKDLVEIVGKDRIVAVLDDEPEQYDIAEDLGLNPILRRGAHNGWVDLNKVRSVSHLRNATSIILERIDRWKEAREKMDRGDFGMPGLGRPLAEYFPSLDGITEGTISGASVTIKADSIHASSLEFPRAPKSDQGARVYSIFDEARDLFVVKNDAYGNTAQFLGAKGQFADMNRKFWKLHQMLWTEELPMYPDAPNEDVIQILKDFIGHCALTIDFLRQEDNKKENNE